MLGVAGDLRKKWQAAGARLSMTGYGQLGVCTDSTAILEYAYRNTVTLYPLAHPANGANADAIDHRLAQLPSDLGATPNADAAKRIATTIPFDDVNDVPFAAFKRQWATLSASRRVALSRSFLHDVAGVVPTDREARVLLSG